MATTSPEAFGAVGAGGNDYLAIQAALDTGKHVEFDPSRRYRFDQQLQVRKTGQALIGGGLRPVGAFDAIRISACRGAEVDLVMHCAGQTPSPSANGYAVLCDGAERVSIRRLFIEDSGSALLGVQGSNSVTVDYVYGIELRSTVGVRWYGHDGLRSDILSIEDGVAAFAASVSGGIGFDWWGNCHSLHVSNFHAVGKPGATSPLQHGLLVRNHAGAATGPQIGRIDSFASDFSQSHGLCFMAGDDIDVDKVYQNGSREGSGIYVDAGLQPYAVRVAGGKTIGNARFGIEAGSQILARDVLSYANALGTHGGAVTGSVLTR